MSPYYRRSPRLVAFWRGEQFVLHPYAHGLALEGSPDVLPVLHAFSSWMSLDTFSSAAGLPSADAEHLLNDLVAKGVLERSTRPHEGDEATVWDTWGDAAAYFHFAARDREYLPQAAVNRRLIARVTQAPPPSPLKSYDGRRRIALPAHRTRSQFHRVLAERRTWRRFGNKAVALADFAAVLQAAFGVQAWRDLGDLGRVMLRSSPSGGARHPIEAYVLARRISGLTAGAYYYAPAEHALVPLNTVRVTSAAIARLLGGQTWFGGAAAIVVLTAVFARKSWAYQTPRAYRSLLLEAGHFCQTFCLAATERKLAPFCTGALSESQLEHALGLDSTYEAVLYVAGVGTRTAGTRLAHVPPGEEKSSPGE